MACLRRSIVILALSFSVVVLTAESNVSLIALTRSDQVAELCRPFLVENIGVSEGAPCYHAANCTERGLVDDALGDTGISTGYESNFLIFANCLSITSGFAPNAAFRTDCSNDRVWQFVEMKIRKSNILRGCLSGIDESRCTKKWLIDREVVNSKAERHYIGTKTLVLSVGSDIGLPTAEAGGRDPADGGYEGEKASSIFEPVLFIFIGHSVSFVGFWMMFVISRQRGLMAWACGAILFVLGCAGSGFGWIWVLSSEPPSRSAFAGAHLTNAAASALWACYQSDYGGEESLKESAIHQFAAKQRRGCPQIRQGSHRGPKPASVWIGPVRTSDSHNQKYNCCDLQNHKYVL
jgi:hypothetical protein